MKEAPPDLGPNHRRGIQAALAHLDRMLCRFEQIARGAEQHSVFYAERNLFSPEARAQLLAEIETIRQVLRRIKRDLRLEADVEDLARDIWADTSGLWQVLVETESRYLKRYGEPPATLAGYLDPLVETIIERVERISRLAWRALGTAGDVDGTPPAPIPKPGPHGGAPNGSSEADTEA